MKVSHADQKIRLLCSRAEGPAHLINFTTGEFMSYQSSDEKQPMAATSLITSQKGWMFVGKDKVAQYFSTVYSDADGGGRAEDFYINVNGTKVNLHGRAPKVSSTYPSMVVNEQDFKMVVHALEDSS